MYPPKRLCLLWRLYFEARPFKKAGRVPYIKYGQFSYRYLISGTRQGAQGPIHSS
jgi:hypothetical protein